MVNDSKSRGLPGFVDKEGRKSNEPGYRNEVCGNCIKGTCLIHSPSKPSYHNPEMLLTDIPASEIENLKRKFRKKQKENSEPMSVVDVFFGNGVARMQQRNARRAILFKYITIWAALILAFSTFLIWKFL